NTDDGSLESFKMVFERKLKMKSIFMKFARTVFSETKAAMVFYPVVKSKVIGINERKEVVQKRSELKVKILHLPKDENIEYEFYPHFDEDDDMDAFIHKYSSKNERGAHIECVKIYTENTIISGVKEGGEWAIVKDRNLFGKIPVVYADIDRPEWEDIVVLLDRYEMRLSRMSDTNDYFADPMLKTYGVTNLPSKETVGKELNFEMKVDPDTGTSYHGDADFLSWQQSIDSVKEENSNLRHEIFSGASCPDLSFDTLLGVGDLSGVAREFMTLDAKIKATEQMEIFGPVVQRAVSIVQAGMANISHVKEASAIEDNYFEVTFGSILPKNLKEELENLYTAGGGKAVNSQETLTARSPFTTNVKEEVKKLKEEEAATAASSNPFGTVV
ncbi:MAG: phage portal protein, partial [Phocaeicola sp.]